MCLLPYLAERVIMNRKYPCFVLSTVGFFFYLTESKFFVVISAGVLAYPVLQLMGKENAKLLDVAFYDDVKPKRLSDAAIQRMVWEANQ